MAVRKKNKQFVEINQAIFPVGFYPTRARRNHSELGEYQKYFSVEFQKNYRINFDNLNWLFESYENSDGELRKPLLNKNYKEQLQQMFDGKNIIEVQAAVDKYVHLNGKDDFFATGIKGIMPAISIVPFDGRRKIGNQKNDPSAIIIDIDTVENASETKKQVIDLLGSNVLHVQKSISGRGVFATVVIASPSQYKQHFNSIKNLLEKNGIAVDTLKDITRLRFLSFDKHAYWNLNAVPYTHCLETSEKDFLHDDLYENFPPTTAYDTHVYASSIHDLTLLRLGLSQEENPVEKFGNLHTFCQRYVNWFNLYGISASFVSAWAWENYLKKFDLQAIKKYYTKEEFEDRVKRLYESDAYKTNHHIFDFIEDKKAKTQEQNFDYLFNEINMVELARSEFLPQKQIWGSLWLENQVCILVAPSEVGKSLASLHVARALAEGTKMPFDLPSDFEGTTQRVLYLDFEMDKRQLHARIGRTEINNIKYLEANENFFSQGTTAMLYEFLRQMAKKYRFIIIDNLTYLGSAIEQKDSAKIIIDNIKSLKKEFGTSFLVVAHTPKNLDYTKPMHKDDMAGSYALGGGVDAMVGFRRSASEDSVMYFKQLKSRDSQPEFTYANVGQFYITKDDPDDMLSIEYLGTSSELIHLKGTKEADIKILEQEIIQCVIEQELSYRQTAKKLMTSKSKVGRVVQQYKKEKNDYEDNNDKNVMS